MTGAPHPAPSTSSSGHTLQVTTENKPVKRREYLHEDRTAHFLDRRLWSRFIGLAAGQRWLAVASFLLLLAAEFLPLLQPAIVQRMIDGPIQQQRADGLWPYIGMFFLIVVATGILEYLKAVASQNLGLRIIHKLRLEVYRRLQHYRMDFFHRTPVGRLMTRLGNDIDSLNSMFTEGLIELLGALLMIGMAVVFMLFMDWRLALASLAVLPFMIFATSTFRVKVRKVNVEIRKWLAELNSTLQESLSGIHVVQVFGKEDSQFQEFDRINKEVREGWLRNVKYYALFFPGISGLTELALAALYFFGGYLFLRDEVSLGTLVALSWYTGMFFRPLRELSDKITTLQTAMAAGERVFTLYDTEASLPSGNVERNDSPLRVDFENVGFEYEEGQPVLIDVSFSVSEGESIAVVGATGSGKSTLLGLLNKFYLPNSGRILLNGLPVQEYRDEDLRHYIGFIPQDVYLFAESVAFNIALSPDFDLQRVEEVCRHVHAHGFISAMPDGYATRLRERGENLSAGQRQLLAFARALYHKPRLLLLDEATSSVDTQTEGLVQDALGRILRETTSIIVAHRLSTIQNARKILVMHKGQIREAGTHGELLKKGGIYAKLYQIQSFE